MAENGDGDRGKAGGGEIMFILASAVIFLAIAGSVVYFVARIVL